MWWKTHAHSAHMYASMHTPTHTPYTHNACAFGMCATAFSTGLKQFAWRADKANVLIIIKNRIHLLLIAFVWGCGLENKGGEAGMIQHAYFTWHLNVQSKSIHTVELPVNHTAVDSTSATAILWSCRVGKHRAPRYMLYSIQYASYVMNIKAFWAIWSLFFILKK